MELHRKILFHSTRLHLLERDFKKLNKLLPEVKDWQGLTSEMELRGIAVLFYRHAMKHHLPVEKHALLAFRGLAMRHKAFANTRYAAVVDIHRAFAAANIPWIALKGLALAPMLYANLADRPMRDMDILVPKEQLSAAADVLRELGYHLPEEQPSKYMRGTHQLPNAELHKDGFLISVEVHHNAIGQDANGSLEFHDIKQDTVLVEWGEIQFLTLPHEQMLHQLCRHLEGFHPAGKLKLINILDVVGYAEQYRQILNWKAIREQYPHILNTLRCLHLIVPLSSELRRVIGGVANPDVKNLADIMLPLSWIFSQRYSWRQRLPLLFAPSDWWLHLYYSIPPQKSLWVTKVVRHPLKVMQWLANRLISSLLGG